MHSYLSRLHLLITPRTAESLSHEARYLSEPCIFIINNDVILNLLDLYSFIVVYCKHGEKSHVLLSPQDQLRYFPASVSSQ